MSRSRAARLVPVVDMAEREEREAARAMGQMQGQLDKAAGQLRELERYRADYQQQWIDAGSKGVSGQWLINYQRFLGQLEAAIAQQLQSVTWHKQNFDKAREQWQQRYARLEGLRKLVQRYLEEARMAEDRREQKLLDELSQRLPRNDPS